jgi:hypothetical protein
MTRVLIGRWTQVKGEGQGRVVWAINHEWTLDTDRSQSEMERNHEENSLSCHLNDMGHRSRRKGPRE